MMRRLMILVIFLASISFLFASDSSQQDVAIDPFAATQVQQEKDGFVFRARYYQTKGPCIRIGNSLAMPAVDGFTVVEVIEGDFKAKSITVRALTGGGSPYPKELVEGKIYTLRLTPSERTKQQLRDNEKDGSSHIAIDGDELKEQNIGK